MENYIPDLLSFRIGYLYQRSNGIKIGEKSMEEEWENCVVSIDDTFLNIANLIEEGKIRVPFLDKDNIENYGWEYEGTILVQNQPYVKTNIHKFIRGDHFILYDFDSKLLMIAFSRGEVHSVNIQHFYCPSINEFDYILHALYLMSPKQ